MEFLRKLFGSAKSSIPPNDEPDEVELRGKGEFDLEVVGESHYQDNLEEICGPRKKDGEDLTIEATLILEDDNKYDRGNAVRVEIKGKQVGYLSKKIARAYRETMKEAGHPNAIAICQANIRGGWLRANDDKGSYGVWLDIPFEE
jgi:hypothetical protein